LSISVGDAGRDAAGDPLVDAADGDERALVIWK
jgi:hypothetical protein